MLLGWGATLPARADERLDRLIAQLGDTDPRIRDAAAGQIRARGLAVRDALVEASHCPYPEVAARARALIGELPWDLPDDPPVARQLLGTYGHQTEFGRKRIITQIPLQRIDAAAVGRIMVRLLVNETSENVRWHVAATIREMRDRTVALELLRRVNLEEERSAAVLGMAGWAWSALDPAKARDMLNRATEALSQSGGPATASADFVFETAIRLDVLGKAYEQAAEVCRRWDKTGHDAPQEEDQATPVAHLFMVHAKFGPVAGFEEDLQRYWAHLADPEVIYCLGLIAKRNDHPIMAEGLYAAAMAAGGGSQQDHYRAGSYLLREMELDLARRELNGVLLSGWMDMGKMRWDCNAHFRLATIAAGKQEDLEAATELQSALRIVDFNRGQRGLTLRGADRRAIDAEMHWRFLRAAKAAHDDASVMMHLDRLVELSPPNAVAALDVVPLLKEHGREAEAKRVFEQSYQRLRANLDAADTPNNKNELAWLCARCGEHLVEALDLAMQANAAAPENAAYLDTAAEANFRLGHREKAIELESKAIGLKSDDKFLKEQLERFRKPQ
jgi:tetratricopeptide (TPR) repeat protein